MAMITRFKAAWVRRNALAALMTLQRPDLLQDAGQTVTGMGDRIVLPPGWWLRFQATAG